MEIQTSGSAASLRSKTQIERDLTKIHACWETLPSPAELELLSLPPEPLLPFPRLVTGMTGSLKRESMNTAHHIIYEMLYGLGGETELPLSLRIVPGAGLGKVKCFYRRLPECTCSEDE